MRAKHVQDGPSMFDAPAEDEPDRPSAPAAVRTLVIESDGGSRGNPGVAGYGALVRDPASGEILDREAGTLGHATNNVAEYSGLIAGLEMARAIDPAAALEVRLDSKLVVEQMSGRWKIKHPDMRPLALRARRLFPEEISFTWVPRAKNKDADALANQAMDGNPRPRSHRLS